MSVKYFTNGNIMDVVNEKIYKGSIVVENGIITQVSEDVACPEGAEVIDFGGKTVSPGIFNCHTHICMSANPKDPRPTSDAQIAIQAIKACKEFVQSGVTFIRDVGGSNYVDIDIRDAAKKGDFVAPEMVVSGKCICMTGGHGWSMGREADGVDDCRKAAREQLRAGADCIKVMATGGVFTKGVEPGSQQLNEDELRAAIEEGHKAGAKSCTHAQGMSGIKAALRAGIDSIEHGFYMDDWCFEWMKEHGTTFVPTLTAVYYTKFSEAGIPEFARKKVDAAYEGHLNTFRGAYKAGVSIALGTDAGTPNNYPNQTGFEMVLMEKAGMTKWDAIKAGTINSAKLVGVEKTHGTIEAGKKANFTVYTSNPIEDMNNVMDCCMTVIGGEVVYKK